VHSTLIDYSRVYLFYDVFVVFSFEIYTEFTDRSPSCIDTR